MKTIFELTTPRSEVLKGELNEEIFAARLKDVMDGTAEPIYLSPAIFFKNTYPTAGLKTLLREVLGRLTGLLPSNNPIIRLETSFGGGKTHNLIALYHAVGGELSPSLLVDFMDEARLLPKAGLADVVGVVGSDLDPTIGILHADDNLVTYTLWGELAYQLGGRAGYALARESDQNKVAPGTGLFEQLIGSRPTLIMIDEIARHLRAAVAMPTATGHSNLAEQTVAFLMSLMEYVASQKRVVLVLTMAGEADAFGKETAELRQTFNEALRVSARQERVLTPTGENEIAAIVVHRLFEQVDREGAQATIERYGAYYRELEVQHTSIHERALRADYLNECAMAYPFHPELIRVLNVKVATIPNFQRTRGALRLLAATVRRLWERNQADRPRAPYLIHPHHLDLTHSSLIEDLTSRLDRPKFKQVCEADIVSPQLGIPAHATEADQLLVASGKPPYASYMGTTIFLHSLTLGIASGIELPELLLATLAPSPSVPELAEGHPLAPSPHRPFANGGDDPALARRALERLYERAWFLEYDGYKYRFKTEPSLNKIIDDEMGSVSTPRAKQEIDGRIRRIWRTGYLDTIYFPTTPSEIGDDAKKPKLALMHYDAIKIDASMTSPPPLIKRLYDYKGRTESFRTYQNNVLFLVADREQVKQMVAVTRRYLAISRITGSSERMREFNETHQHKLRKMGEAAQLEVRIAITKAYRYLFYPSPDGNKEESYLRRESVPAQAQGDTDQDQTNVIVRVLHDLKKVLSSDDKPLSARFLKSKAWDRQQVEITTEALRRAFARKISLRILLDMNQLRRSIENGVKSKVWLYYDPQEGFAYDHESPPTLWQISDDTRLYLPAEAERLGLRIKGKWQPPASTSSANQSESALQQEEDDDAPPAEWLAEVLGDIRPDKLTGFGPPAQAFQQIRDHCDEHKAVALQHLQLSFEGVEPGQANDLVAIGLAIPQLGRGTLAIGLNLTVQFDPPPGERFELNFQGSWKRYKRLKSVTDAFGRERVHSLHLKFRLTLDFGRQVPLNDRQLNTIQDVLVQMNMGPISVTAEPVYEEA